MGDDGVYYYTTPLDRLTYCEYGKIAEATMERSPTLNSRHVNVRVDDETCLCPRGGSARCR